MSAVLVDLDAVMAEQAGYLNVAGARVVATIAEALDRHEWQGYGIASPEHWVKLRLGVSHSRARVLVAVARRYSEFPDTFAEFVAGGLSLEQVFEVVTRAPAWADARMADFAGALTVSQLQRVLREEYFDGPPGVAAEQPTLPGEPSDENRSGEDPSGEPAAAAGVVAANPPDYFACRWEGGRLVGSFDLGADRGTVVEAIFEQMRDELFRATGAPASNAEAFAEIVARAGSAGGPVMSLEWGNGSRLGDMLGRLRTFLHLELTDDADQLLGRLSNGARLPDSMVEYLTCDGSITPVWTRDRVPVGYGREQRIVPVKLRRLIRYRDHGCRVPGCGTSTIEIHHLVHWEDGGGTDTHNLIALCPKHHRMHHQGLLAIRGNPDRPDGVEFYDSTGRPIHGPVPIKPDGPLTPPTKPYEPPTGERMDLRWFGGWSKQAIDHTERLRQAGQN